MLGRFEITFMLVFVLHKISFTEFTANECVSIESRKKSLVEKNDNGKKAWWKKHLLEKKPGVFYKMWKKSLVSDFVLLHENILLR